MACALGVEQDCNECRMCGNGKGGKKMFVVNGDMFGRYVKIPHVLAEDGEKFIFKVVGRLQSNAYYNVPIGGVSSQIEIHKEIIDVLHVIQCGIDETEVLTVALKDCELIEPRTNADRIRNMTNEELSELLCEKFCHGVGENLIKEWLESECDSE